MLSSLQMDEFRATEIKIIKQKEGEYWKQLVQNHKETLDAAYQVN